MTRRVIQKDDRIVLNGARQWVAGKVTRQQAGDRPISGTSGAVTGRYVLYVLAAATNDVAAVRHGLPTTSGATEPIFVVGAGGIT